MPKPAVVGETDIRHFAGKDVLIGRADDEVVDDRIVDKPADENDRDRDPAKRQEVAQAGSTDPACALPVAGAVTIDAAIGF